MLVIETGRGWRQTDRPEGEDTQLLHDVKFSSLIEVQDVREQTGIPIEVKLLLLHVIVITHLQDGGSSGGRGDDKSDDRK